MRNLNRDFCMKICGAHTIPQDYLSALWWNSFRWDVPIKRTIADMGAVSKDRGEMGFDRV